MTSIKLFGYLIMAAILSPFMVAACVLFGLISVAAGYDVKDFIS